jgi:colanic acid/amylovoran biosynthesis glycosyltransferase
MKIAVVVPSFPAITETFIINHITGLIDEGHDVTIIALRENVSPQRHKIVDDYKLLSRTTFVKNIPSNKMLCRIYSAWLIFTNGLRYPRKITKALCYLLFLNRAEFYQKLFLAIALLPLRCDIYHFHFGQVGRLGAAVKKMGLPVKMITSLHGADVNQIPRQKEKDYYSELFETGDHFVANTEFTKKQAVDLGCDGNKISVIPVALHIRDFPFRARSIAGDETVQILTVGRLVEKKGHQYSIRAIAEIVQQSFKVHYTIAGDGPRRKLLEDLVDGLDLSEHVTFAGEVTQEEVIELYGKSHLFVLSSVTASNGDREGQALVLQEAQACGLPAISTWHNGIPDGILDGQSGFLVPEKDIDALATAIKKLLENPSSWAQMGQMGRAFVEKGYDTKVITTRLIHWYEGIKKPLSKRGF